jgi:FMN-dependent NADH-azoreductase
MQKLLYITVSPSPEEESISKKLGNSLIQKYKEKFKEDQIEQLDLYTSFIPDIYPKYLMDELKLAKGAVYDKLSDEEKRAVDRIDELSDQFLAADAYVIATPMWDLSFPAKLKSYIDCICLGGRVIDFKGEEKKPEGLLADKERTMIYLQTSGGDFPFFLEGKMNHGVKYCKDLFTGLGIKHFEKILVEGVIQKEDEREKYLEKAHKQIDHLIENLKHL